MQSKLDSAVVQEALRVVSKLAPPTQGNVTLNSDGTKIVLSSSGELNHCSITLAGEVTGSASFAIPIDSLRDATKGRNELDLQFKNTMLRIKSGAYRAELSTVDAIQLEAEVSTKEFKKFKVDVETAGWLKSAVQAVILKPNPIVSSYMPVGVKISEKGAFVSCFDTNHMSFLQTKEIKGSLQFVIPVETLQAILEAFGQASFTIAVSDSGLEVGNKQVKARLSLPEQEENGPSFDDVIAKAREASKTTGIAMLFPKAELVSFLDNSRAVAGKERGEIKIVSDGKIAKLSITTVNGTVETSIKIQSKKKVDLAVDFEYFDEFVRKSGDTVDLQVVDGAFIIAKTAKTTNLVSLNQA